MNRVELLGHLEHDHHAGRALDSYYRQKPTRAELNSLHTRLHLEHGDEHPFPAKQTKETNMSTDVPAIPAPDLKVDLNRPLSPAEGAALRSHAMEYVTVEGFSRPIPRFMDVLPRMESNEAITDAIAAQLLTSPNPDRMPDADGTIAFAKLVGRTVTVWDLAVMPGDKDGGWAGYLLMDITLDGEEEHIVANTGAKEAVMRLAIAWARDELPLTGRPTLKPINSTKGHKPVMFIADKDFFAEGNGQQVGA